MIIKINPYFNCNKNKNYKNSFGIPKISFEQVKNSDIFRFKKVDETLYRGARPNERQIVDLKKMGINTIIDLSIAKKSPEKINIEKQAAEFLGIKYINLPFLSGDIPTEKDVDVFFNTIKNAKKNNEKVYIHCLEGKIRTGLYVSMYQLKYGLSDINFCKSEMIKAIQHTDGNEDLIDYLQEFYQTNVNKTK